MTMTDEREAVETVQHTPGPWAVDSDRYGTFVRAIQTGNTIIDVHEPLTVASGEAGTMEKRRILEANARLIAAAPALLEALEQIQRSRMDGEGWDCIDPKLERLWPVLEAAIRAARGEE